MMCNIKINITVDIDVAVKSHNFMFLVSDSSAAH